MAEITLITGGSRSGKSSYALQLAQSFEKKIFIATAEAFDDEMQLRINHHRQERMDSFDTLEVPVKLPEVLKQINSDQCDLVLIDCLTVWTGNLMHYHPEDNWMAHFEHLIKSLQNMSIDCILVTNEVGMGLVPESPMGRQFRDLAGLLNQKVAAVADRLFFVVSGVPMQIK